jgi:hypothetical protein
MIIFAEHITPRLEYTLNYIFKLRFNIEYSIVSDINKILNKTGLIINYSNKNINTALQIKPSGLLLEDKINKLSYPNLSFIGNLPVIYRTDGDFSFDIFSSVFWFLSRYEEYLPYKPDLHNRFPATGSFLFKNNLLNRPVVDEQILFFKNFLNNKFSSLKLQPDAFKAVTTIDIDSPWCYKNKGIVRNTAGFVRDILKGKINNVELRLQVLLNKKPDPWYIFKNINALHKNTGINLKFFIHTGNYGKYDKSASYKTAAFKNFVLLLTEYAEIGLHPSYKAASNIQILSEEKNRLEKLSKKTITGSRQHFLVFTLPDYYRMLIYAGITSDYSMGFADIPGFRAATSRPFYFFDLPANKQTKLIIYPFVVMDRTLNSYQKEHPQQAFKTIATLIENTKKVNGNFVSLWHNESLSNMFEWEDWFSVFQKMTSLLTFR